jgi:hypothetical protein
MNKPPRLPVRGTGVQGLEEAEYNTGHSDANAGRGERMKSPLRTGIIMRIST